MGPEQPGLTCPQRASGPNDPRAAALLQVALDRAFGADGGGVGVLAGVAAGAALAQQVPALVEGDLDLVEAGLLGLVEAVAGGLALEGVLLLDQGADAAEDLPVVHGASLYCICWWAAPAACRKIGAMRTRSFLLAALVAAFLLCGAAVPAGAAGTGTPRTWGSNSFGELGSGGTANRFSPGPVAGLTDATELAGGREHVVALRADGTVWTWGSNQYGQQGNGSSANRPTPGPVAGLAGAVQVAAGHYHGMALLGDGTVRAWGMNSQGQLGDGTKTKRTRPVQVRNLTGVASIAGGRDHGLAVLGDGTVRAWGANTYGQLGDGTTTRRTSPVTVPGLSGVETVTAGRAYSAAL
jgi:hypothetical protein